MSSVCRISLLTAGLLALLSAPPAARAQDKKNAGDTVRITTVDGVELQGSFFKSAKETAPTVLVLHALGEDSRKKNYQELAAALQKEYNVMLFDFRGHGNSKSVQPELFWKQKANQSYLKGAAKGADTIEYKDYQKQSAYLPYLVNDIAAVKAFLDRKNDQQTCNTFSFIVIGAETGATLGAIWLNSEWHRYKMTAPQMFGQVAQPASNPEGKDTIAAIWAGISPSLGSLKVGLASVHDVPAKQGGTSVMLLYGEDSAADKNVAKGLEKAIKGTAASKEGKYKYTYAVPIPKVKLSGQNLLSKALGADEAIKDHLARVVSERGNEWTEREFTKTLYAWRNPGVPLLSPNAFKPAKPANEKNFNFDSYGTFAPSR